MRIHGRRKLVLSLSDASSHEVGKLIKSYLRKIGWIIIEENPNNPFCTLKAENSEKSFIKLFRSGQPQIASWVLKDQNDDVVIEISFDFRTDFSNVLDSVLSSLFLLTLVGCIFPSLLRPESGFGPFLILAPLVTGVAILCYVLSHIIHSDEYERFMLGFHSSLYNATQKKVCIISEPILLAGRRFIILYGFLFLIFVPFFLAIVQGSEISNLPWWPVTILLILAVLFILLMSVLAINDGSDLDERWTVHIPFLIVGSFLVMYAFIPLGIYNIEQSGAFQITQTRLVGVFLFLAVGAYFFPSFLYSSWIFFRRREEVKYATRRSRSHPLPIVVNVIGILLWAFCSLMTLTNFYLACAALEYAIFGRSAVFQSQSISTLGVLYGRVGAVVYSVPILAIVFVLIYKRWTERAGFNTAPHASLELISLINLICIEAGAGLPRVIVEEGGLVSDVEYVPTVGPVLRISQRVLAILTSDELRAVLAHEVFHIKKHSRKFVLLDLLSEWTLFGKGFLAIVLDTRQLEYDADRFAVEFLKRKKTSKEVLITALQKLLIEHQRQKYLARSKPRLAFGEHHYEMDEPPQTFKDKMKWLYEVYFGDKIVSYLRPTIEERIKRIEAMV